MDGKQQSEGISTKEWQVTPESVRQLVMNMLTRLEQLQQEVAPLSERVNQNSQNSSKPPSSDPPAVKRHAPPKQGQRKRRIRPGLALFPYPTAWRTIRGYEAMRIIRKG